MSALLTLRQDGFRHDIILSDGKLRRFVNVHTAYRAMAEALDWIAKNPGAQPECIKQVAEEALQSLDAEPAEVPFHG